MLTMAGLAFPFHPRHLLLLLLFFSLPLTSTCLNSTVTSRTVTMAPATTVNVTTAANSSTDANPTPTPTSPTGPDPPALNTTTSNSSGAPAPGCGADLDPIYSDLCDKRAAWGIVVESLASLGFVVSCVLLLGLLVWALWVCVAVRRRRRGIGGVVASTALFLLATAGVFGLTFAFVVGLTPRTCPTRLFLFGVLFGLAFATLLARSLALLGFALARGWGEPGVALALALVQVIVATEWLITVLVRDGQPCAYSQAEFVLLLVFVLCVLGGALVLSLRLLHRACSTYSYSYTGGTHLRAKARAALLCLTLALSAAVWVVWVALLTRGNGDMGRRPAWDDPVLSVALVANGWVLLLGHGLAQVGFLCCGEARAKDRPLDFAGWTSPNTDVPGLASPKEGRENGSFENDAVDRRGKGNDPVLRSPYESGFSMTEIDPDKDYSIPRPQTTNMNEPYDEYYGHRLSD